MSVGRVTIIAGSLLAGLLLPACSSSPSSSATTVSQGASAGCGAKPPATLGPHDLFEGVVAIPRQGVTPDQVLASIPNAHQGFQRWCATRVFVHPAASGSGGPSEAGVPGEAAVVFLAKASTADVQRAAAYLRGTGLFATVTVVQNRQYY